MHCHRNSHRNSTGTPVAKEPTYKLVVSSNFPPFLEQVKVSMDDVFPFGGLGLVNYGSAVLLVVDVYRASVLGRRLTEAMFFYVVFFSANVCCLFKWLVVSRGIAELHFHDYLILSLPGLAWMFIAFVLIAYFRPLEVQPVRIILQKTDREKMRHCLKLLAVSICFILGLWLAFSVTHFQAPTRCGIRCNLGALLFGNSSWGFAGLSFVSTIGGMGPALYLFCLFRYFSSNNDGAFQARSQASVASNSNSNTRQK